MNWNPKTWKFNFSGMDSKQRWLILLALGLILLLLALPNRGGNVKKQSDMNSGAGSSAGGTFFSGTSSGGTSFGGTSPGMTSSNIASSADEGGETDGTARTSAGATSSLTYEQQMEKRLEELLSKVDGVGEVEVMIVLSSSGEKVWRVDRDLSSSSTRETDASGGSRQIQSQDTAEETVLTGQGGSGEPLLEKELYPQVSGVVVSAAGGGSPAVQAEISAAVEALFGIPPHKIKILKRVE